jgi:hypothetical protein
MDSKKKELKNFYCFIAAQSVANEYYKSFQHDIIESKRKEIENTVFKTVNREQRRRFLKESEKWLKDTVVSSEKYIKTTDGLLKQLEKDKKSSAMLDDMIEELTKFLDDSAEKNITI